MSTGAQFARAWLDWTVAASWQLALLVCFIAVLVYLLRDASPQLRYGLWLLVLLKALLPPTLAVFWGVGTWGVAPVVGFSSRTGSADTVVTHHVGDFSPTVGSHVPQAMNGAPAIISAESPWLLVWAVGCMSLWLAVAWRYWRFAQMTNSMRRIDEGPARVELERIAVRFSVHSIPELYTTEQLTSPMLVGLLRPKIVLPQPILERLNPEELRMVIAHELAHWRRRDTWVGWLQVFVQGIFWFHPLIWLANARIRHERECACDETVLREVHCDRDGYGETIMQVLAAVRGRSLVMANMVGIFERGSLLQNRLEDIMSFDPTKRRFGWLSRVALVVVALILLPMAAPRVQADRTEDALAAVPTQSTTSVNTERVEKVRPKTNWPTIVATTPKIGATDVDPGLEEITVTFDRDMNVSGYSWTGGGPSHPPSPADASAVWIDKRTCILPVTLKKASYYRVGINSTSFQNFRSELGVPAPTSAIYFATAGATRTVTSRVRVPKVVKMLPENGAMDVDPGLKMIRVKFSMPMSTDGYSWTGGGPTFPTIRQGEKPRWSRDGKTCMLPVELKPGTRYELGLNSFRHKNFASKWGVPIEPVQYSFQTTGDATEDEMVAGPPRIVKMKPKNGAKDVDPALTKIQVTFDRPMAEGFSWTGGGDQFPIIPDGEKPYWSKDRKTCTLPVELKPDWKYRFGMNSRSFKNFASADGVPFEPIVYEFHTSPGDK